MISEVRSSKGERLNDDELIRVRGRDYSANAVRLEVKQKFDLMLAIFARNSLLERGERHRAKQLHHLRREMKDELRKGKKHVSHKHYKAIMRRVRDGEKESLAMSASLKNYGKTKHYFVKDLRGLVVFVEAMLDPSQREVLQ